MEYNEEYYVIDIDLIDFKNTLDIDLYYKTKDNKYKLYLKSGHKFTNQKQQNIRKEVKNKKLYIKRENKSFFMKYMEKSLTNIVNNPMIEDIQKSDIVHKTSLKVMQDMFKNPNYENIIRSKNSVGALVDLIFNNDNAANILLNVKTHDEYTYEHSVHVGIFGISLVRDLFKGDEKHDPYKLGLAFFFHDLGKVKVPSEIINKPDKLTEQEWKKMKTHPYQGYKLLKDLDCLTQEMKQIVYCHHERDDGKGYPRGLRGKDIPLYGRIAVIADVFDALTAERSYKPSMSTFEALKIMKGSMYSFFDKEIFSKFTLLFDSKKRTRERLIKDTFRM